MSVYVDDMEAPFGNMIMCHCWADSLDELFIMVDKIGVSRKWIQGHPDLSIGKAKNASWLHFDISKSKRKLAVINGAVETDRVGPLEFEARRLLATGKHQMMVFGAKKLARVIRARCGGKAFEAILHHDDPDPVMTGWFIVSFDSDGQSFDQVGAYDTYQQALELQEKTRGA